ncbi:hypothetical protein [Polaromonas sp. SM01]|uniref:hypothetical protein n=1 Tax=Polaromonas sp. SM01 TaxID=3085630 RepID=UPI0029811F08|nr:hypothetical protein [Polaromonas sp. SM01]MDW5441638.1 hypothetical protein [Polaromonas sp. SM01]
MFERLKKVFVRSEPDALEAELPEAASPLSEWANTQGFGYASPGGTAGFVLTGKVRDKAWKLESGPPSRDYIEDQEFARPGGLAPQPGGGGADHEPTAQGIAGKTR